MLLGGHANGEPAVSPHLSEASRRRNVFISPGALNGHNGLRCKPAGKIGARAKALGVGGAYHLRKQCPGTSFVVLEEQESDGPKTSAWKAALTA